MLLCYSILSFDKASFYLINQYYYHVQGMAQPSFVYDKGSYKEL